MECLRLLFDHLPWIEHQFLSGKRDSRKAGSLWRMVRGVGGVRKSIDQRWLAKGLGLGLQLLCWGFKGVQERIPLEEASAPNQVSGISARTMYQSTTPSLSQTIWQDEHQDFRFKWTSTAAIGIHPTKAWLSQLVNFKNPIWHFRRTICNRILF